MEETNKITADMREEELVELLGKFYVEPVEEAHFEERFLVSFHDKVVQQAVCQPARAHLWENLSLFFTGLNKAKLALSSVTFLGFGAFTLAMTDWAFHSDSAPATASRERVKRSMLASVDSLRSSAALPSSLEKSSDLQIIVAATENSIPYYGNKGDILFEQEHFEFSGTSPNLGSSDSELGNNFSW